MTAVESLSIKAEKRTERGKEWAGRARRNGIVPGVIYGAHGESIPVAFDNHDFLMLRQTLAGEQKLITVEVEGGESESAFIKDIQRDPVSYDVLHVDFLRVKAGEELTMSVHVHATGSTPEGVREGGLLEQLAHEIEVTAWPRYIPGHVEADLSNLNVGESFHVSDLPEIPNVKYASDPDLALFTIISKAKMAAAAEAAEAAEGSTPAEGAGGEAPAEEKKEE